MSAVAVSPDGKTLASYTHDGMITLWNLATGKTTATFPTKLGGGGAVAFAPDGKSLVVTGENGAREQAALQPLKFFLCSAEVWDLATQKERLTIDFPEQGAAGGLITPDGKSLIAGGPTTGVVLYDLGTGKPSDPLDMDKDYWDVHAMALSPDGTALAVCARSGAVLLWDLEKKAARWTLPPDGTRRNAVLAFSPDGKTVASSDGYHGVVSLWDAVSGKPTGRMDFHPRVKEFMAIAFSPDGKTLAVGGSRWGVSLWDLAAGGERDDFEGDVSIIQVRCVAFTPDGKTLITGGWDKDKAIWFWDVPQGKCTGVKPVGQWTPQEAIQVQQLSGH